MSVLVASAVTLILVGRSGGPLASAEGSLRSVARAALVPVESAGDAAFRPLEAVVAGLGRSGDLAEARAALVRERQRAESQAARAEAMAAEARRLAELLALDGPAGGDGVAARVVSVHGARTGAPFMLDRGTADGVAAGMPVVAGGGLVGRVLEAGPGHSTVLPLTDASSAVGVRAGERGAAGVGQGLGSSRLRLDVLDPGAALRAGDLVVTSGLRHSRFPAGLPVGRVAGERGRYFVQPFTAPDRLEVVKVLRWEPEA